MPTPIPPMDELSQMSTEDLEALAAEVAQESGMPPMGEAVGGEMPPMEEAPPADMPLEEEVAEAEMTEAVEGESPTDAAEVVLGQILAETQDPLSVVEQLGAAGFEIRPIPGAAEAEAEEEALVEAEVEADAEEASAASVSEPVNLRDLTKKATANAMKKGA